MTETQPPINEFVAYALGILLAIAIVSNIRIGINIDELRNEISVLKSRIHQLEVLR